MKQFDLEIHFPVSRSKVYPEVLKRARLFFNFSEKPNILKISDIDELFGRWDDFSLVIFNTTKWAGTNVFFDGKPLLPYKNDFFYRLLDIRHCYTQYKDCVDKERFCSSTDWGCHRLKYIGRYFSLNNYYSRNPFYKYGYFRDSETWIIDKEKIFQVLLEESKLNMADQCPAFDPERVKEAISKLPDLIKLNEHWEVEHQLDVTKKGVVGIPTSINFVMNPEPVKVNPGDDFIEPGSDEHLDKLLKERNKNRSDEYSDLL